MKDTPRTKVLLEVVLLVLVLSLAKAQEFLPGDNLVVEGIPPIPASLVEEVGRYTKFRSAAFLSWHPERREMLIVTRFGNTTQVHRVAHPAGARTQLTFFDSSVYPPGVSYQPREGKYFIFSKDRGGDEFYQHYLYNLATGVFTLFTDGKSRNFPGLWSNAGDRFVYGSTRRNGVNIDLYIVNRSDPPRDRLLALLEPRGGWDLLDWSPDDRAILVREYVSVNESYLWLFQAATGERILLTPKGAETVSYGGGQFSQDGKGVYVRTDCDSEFQRLAYIDLETKRHSYLTDNLNWDVEGFHLSPDGKTIAFVTNEDGVSVLHLMDTVSGKKKPAPRLPLGVISGLRWHKNGRDLGFTFTSYSHPADAYSIDVPSGKLERWTYSETGGLNTEEFVEPQIIHWKSFDGRAISGLLYRPPARFTGRRPVVIDIHGGPEDQALPWFLGRNNFLLNELGVALLFPNVRGSRGYGKTFLTLDNGFLREGSYKDIGALLDWIKTAPDLDADRIMVTGPSYGGHMTLAVATLYSDRIRCAVDVVGPSNLVSFLERTAGYRQDRRRVEYGDERDPKMRAFLQRIAPLNNAQKITRPLFVIQGQNDPRVPRAESEQMVASVRKNGIPVWYLMAKDEGHGFVNNKRNADFQFYATVLFMQEHLLK